MESRLEAFLLGSNGQRLDNSRHRAINFPYVGTPPLVPDAELQANSKTFYRFGYGVFNSADPLRTNYYRTYGELMEAVCRGGTQICRRTEPYREEDGSFTTYVEWVDVLMHDANSPPPARIEPEEYRPVSEAQVTWEQAYNVVPVNANRY